MLLKTCPSCGENKRTQAPTSNNDSLPHDSTQRQCPAASTPRPPLILIHHNVIGSYLLGIFSAASIHHSLKDRLGHSAAYSLESPRAAVLWIRYRSMDNFSVQAYNIGTSRCSQSNRFLRDDLGNETKLQWWKLHGPERVQLKISQGLRAQFSGHLIGPFYSLPCVLKRL